MATSPVALNSASVNWRSPDTTNPVGRLQGDVKPYFWGGLEVVDNPGGLLGPDGNPLCGVSIDLEGLSQSGVDPGDGSTTGVLDPPDGYQNPLRITENGDLWIDQSLTPTFIEACVEESYTGRDVVAASAPESLGTTVSVCVENTTSQQCLVERKVSLLNAAIFDPPPSAGGTFTIDLEVALPEYTVDDGPDPSIANPTGGATGTTSITCAQIEGCDDARSMVLYYLRVNGGFDIHAVRACTGTCPSQSMTYDLPPLFVGAGETLTMTVEPRLQQIVTPTGTYSVFPGTIRACMKMICLPSGGSFTATPTC